MAASALHIPALVALAAAVACADPLLDPPPPGEGWQVSFRHTIPAATDYQVCQFFTVPEGGLVVNRARVAASEGTHHFILLETDYDAIPTQGLSGQAYDTSGVFECPSGAGDFRRGRALASAQNRTPGDVYTMPDGLGFPLPAGRVVILNVHATNATAEPLDLRVKVNLYSLPRGSDVVEPGFLLYSDAYLHVPAGETSVSRIRCPVTVASRLLSAQSHMHEHATAFLANLVGPDGAVKAELYRTTAWDEVPIASYGDGLPMAPGDWIDFRCEYRNPTTTALVSGPLATDVMCQFMAFYTPRDPLMDGCFSAPDTPHESASQVVGSGAATCAAVSDCLLANQAPERDEGAGAETFIDCVLTTCPGVSPEVSALARCIGDARPKACRNECATTLAGACETCVRAACADALSACTSATCG